MKYNSTELITLLLGLFLIVEAIGSFFLLEHEPLFQFGRIIRVIIGFFFLYLVFAKRVK